MHPPAADPHFLERLGRALGSEFEVLNLLGRGGFADVYQIRDRKLDRTLAIKVLRPEIAWGAWMISRFEREARALASLNHLNIPPIHFVGDNEGLVYYVMPLISGRSLGDMLIDNGPLDPGAVVNAMIPVLDALHHAHHLGIVHRDIKPDNIIIESGTGRPLLVDFGVAKQLKRSGAGNSLPGIIMGTPGYVSPEQACGQDDIDARSDVYAIGATMFHLLTGTMIFPGTSDVEILGRQLTGASPPAHERNPRVPNWLSDILARALAPDRGQRFQTAADMADALREGSRAGIPGTPVPPMVERIRDDDPTPRMVPAANGKVAPPWQRRSSRAPSPVRSARRSRFSWPLFLGLAGSVAAYFLLVPVTFTLQNNLLLPVEFSTDNGVVRTIPAGGEMSLQLQQDGRVVGRWFVVQPTLDSTGPQAGEPVSGMIRIDGLNATQLLLRRTRRSIDSWSEGSGIFAPMIRNETSRPVRVTVSRAGGLVHCNCSVEPGEARLLGYYRLESSSFVRVEAVPGLATVFRDLESRMNLNTGMLELAITDSSLVPSNK
jgi:serine/threonine protein kinase